jgi:hypothetical protein
VRERIVPVVFGPALVLAPGAASRAMKDVPPFAYTFRITSISVNGTFSHGTASAATVLHLATLPRQRTLTWLGKTAGGLYNGVGNTRVQLAGKITYSGLEPVCSGTVDAAMPRSYSVVASIYLGDARNPVVTHPTIRLEFGKLAIGDIYPGRNGKCTNALTFYQYGQDVKPFGIIGVPGFTFHAHHAESFADDAFADGLKTDVEWSATVTVRKIGYQKIDCAHSQLC